MHITKIALSLLFSLPFSNLYAGQVEKLDSYRIGPTYTFYMRIKLNADINTVWPLIDDFSQLQRMNDSILSSSFIPSPDPELRRIRLKARFCVWFFCRHLEQIQDLAYLDQYEVITVVIPNTSDFRAGWAKWKLSPNPEPNTCILEIDMALTPDFWIPPLIGPYLISRKLRAEGVETALGLERLVLAAVHGQ